MKQVGKTLLQIALAVSKSLHQVNRLVYCSMIHHR